MATIEEAVRQMLVNNAGTLPSGRISYGYRPQNDALPAVTFTVSGVTPQTVGSPALYTAEVTVNGVAELTIDAAAMVDPIVQAIDSPGTYDGIDIHSVVVTSRATNDPMIGIGDEQEPAISTVSATIYFEF